MLTGVAVGLGDHRVCRQIIQHVALIRTNRGDNVASGMHGKSRRGAGMGAEAGDFTTVLENLYRARRRGNNRLLTRPHGIGNRTVRLKLLQDLLLRQGEDANDSVNSSHERNVSRGIDRQSLAAGRENLGAVGRLVGGDGISSSPSLRDGTLAATLGETVLVSTNRSYKPYMQERNIRCLCALNPCEDSLRKASRIHLHSLSAGSTSAAGTDRNLRQRITSLISFLGQTSDHANGGVMLIQGGAQFLPGLGQGLSQGVCFQGEGIPFFLEHAEEGGNGGEGRWPGSNNALSFHLDQVFGREFLSIDGVFSVLGDVCFDEPLLKDAA